MPDAVTTRSSEVPDQAWGQAGVHVRVGTALMTEVEARARGRGAALASLDTSVPGTAGR